MLITPSSGDAAMVTQDPKVDVVTVGAGWTANILAWKLTAAGHSVLSLEQGPAEWTFPDFSMDHDPEAYVIRKRMMIDIAVRSMAASIS